MTKIEIISAMHGHNRQAARWEAKARKEGPESEAKRLHKHHCIAWLELNAKLKKM